MGRNKTQKEGFKKVMSYFIGQKEVELSLSPTVVMPLLTTQDKPYKVRVLMDSGSMTNWLAKDLLDKLNYTVKGHDPLEVYTLTGKTTKKFKLVEIYYYYNGQRHKLICYVHDAFAQHVTVRGMPEFVRKNSALTEDISNSLVDPATQEVDHKDISLGIGLILCTASSNKIRRDSTTRVKSINILLEPTIFGTAISGSVPPALRGNVSALGVYHSVPRLVDKPTSEALFRVEEEDDIKHDDSQFVENKLGMNNIGFRILKSMGWTEGRGLGKKEEGRTTPVNMSIHKGKRGFGNESTKKRVFSSKVTKKRKITKVEAVH